MRPFEGARSVTTPLDRANVDTDQIIPKQFLKLVQRTGFGRYLFYDWRKNPDNGPDPGFVLDDPRYYNSEILVTGANFGCGSSREHAVWALADHGFSVIVAPSFADIFRSNCIKNGLLPAQVSTEDARALLQEKKEVTVDLKSQEIRTGSGIIPFEIDPRHRDALLEGADEISNTLKLEDEIAAFERASAVPSVW